MISPVYRHDRHSVKRDGPHQCVRIATSFRLPVGWTLVVSGYKEAVQDVMNWRYNKIDNAKTFLCP